MRNSEILWWDQVFQKTFALITIRNTLTIFSSAALFAVSQDKIQHLPVPPYILIYFQLEPFPFPCLHVASGYPASAPFPLSLNVYQHVVLLHLVQYTSEELLVPLRRSPHGQAFVICFQSPSIFLLYLKFMRFHSVYQT